MASVAQPLASDKFAALGLLDKQAIEQICREQGYQWQEVKLPPGKTLQCFGWQVLMGNVPLDAVAHHRDAVQRPGLLHGSPASAAGGVAGGLAAGGAAGVRGSRSQSKGRWML